MVHINLSIPEDLRTKAAQAAESQGVSLEDFVRECLADRLRSAQDDPFLSDAARFTGQTPSDLSANHDGYLYGSES